MIRNIQRPLSNLGRMFSDEPQDEAPSDENNSRDPQPIPNIDARAAPVVEDRSQQRLQPDVDVNNIVE